MNSSIFEEVPHETESEGGAGASFSEISAGYTPVIFVNEHPVHPVHPPHPTHPEHPMSPVPEPSVWVLMLAVLLLAVWRTWHVRESSAPTLEETTR